MFYKKKKIMKKTYMIPDMEIIKIQTQKMLAESLRYDGTTDDESGNLARELVEFEGF